MSESYSAMAKNAATLLTGVGANAVLALGNDLKPVIVLNTAIGSSMLFKYVTGRNASSSAGGIAFVAGATTAAAAWPVYKDQGNKAELNRQYKERKEKDNRINEILKTICIDACLEFKRKNNIIDNPPLDKKYFMPLVTFLKEILQDNLGKFEPNEISAKLIIELTDIVTKQITKPVLSNTLSIDNLEDLLKQLKEKIESYEPQYMRRFNGMTL